MNTDLHRSFTSTSNDDTNRQDDSSAVAPPKRKIRVMMLVRRCHLYLGLFLLPWVLLYGTSAFLFNHSEIANQQPIQRFSKTAFRGTPLESPVSPESIAEKVVSELNRRAPATVYKMERSFAAAYEVGAIQGSELIFGSITFPDRKIHILMHVNASGGAVRTEVLSAPKLNFTSAPFAVNLTEEKSSTIPNQTSAPVFVDDTIDKQALASISGLVQNLGFNTADGITRVTQVPDLVFRLDDGKQVWQVRYNSMKGSVAGKLLSEVRPSEVTWRSFLTRLHTIHGYPFAMGPRWIWTLFVDVMAALMVYWGFSGLLMWWQIKATRQIGLYIMTASISLAGFLGFSLYQWLAVPI